MAMLKPDSLSMAQRALALGERLDQVLGLILEALDTNVDRVAVTDISSDPGLQKDFPVKGAQRWILHRTPDGRTLELAENVLTDFMPANVNRLGGTIVNSGNKPVRLWLATTNTKNNGSAPIFLEPEGGSWDFRLGNLFWSGSVCAESIGGAGRLEVVEV